MTRSLTDEQRKHIDAAIDDYLKPSNDNSREEAFRGATRQVLRWEQAKGRWDRDSLREELQGDAEKLDEIQEILNRLYHPIVYGMIHEGRYPDGVIPEVDEEEVTLSTGLWRRAQRLRRVAEELPYGKRGPKGNVVNNRIWQHTVGQFRRHHPDASVADKRAYADRLFWAINANANYQSWRRPTDNYNKKNRRQGQARSA